MEDSIIARLEKWCAYQERSQEEVRLKLRALKVDAVEIEPIIAQLISDNFINEQRFAMAFAGGKFRMKGWGKRKITAELKRHKISDANIRTALNAIGDDEYHKSVRKWLIRYGFAPGAELRRKLSIRNKLVMKGFEPDVVNSIMNIETNDIE